MPLIKGRRSRNNFKHLSLCFSNFKDPFTHESPPMSPSSKSSSFIQHKIDHNRPSPSTTTTTSSSIMIRNFNFLYDYQHTLILDQHYPLHSSFQLEAEPEPEPPDFATIFASQRFFISSPGHSNSILESTTLSSSSSLQPQSDFWYETLGISSSSLPPSHFWSGTLGIQKSHWSSTNQSSFKKTRLKGQNSTRLSPPPSNTLSDDDDDNNKKREVFLNGSVAVPTYSQDPYLDFRRSMEEMVEARPEVMWNWEVLQELLVCYLKLNCKSNHKFIVGAFADLVVSIMSFTSSSSSSDEDDEGAVSGGGGC